MRRCTSGRRDPNGDGDSDGIASALKLRIACMTNENGVYRNSALASGFHRFARSAMSNSLSDQHENAKLASPQFEALDLDRVN